MTTSIGHWKGEGAISDSQLKQQTPEINSYLYSALHN
jgi:hypothetical protein